MSEIFTAVAKSHDGLPRPPGWRVHRDQFIALDVAARTALLRSLEQGQDGYWVLHQGAMAAGSQRQLLANLDSAVSLQAALAQRFSQTGDTSTLLIQRLPPQRSAGVLFSHHPRRPDLDHVVVELSASEGATERLILHADGQLAWCSEPDSVPAALVSALAELAIRLKQANTLPSAAEWVWDGNNLWVIQVLSIGSLPVPKEAWTRHSPAVGVQVITPLWYTLFGRWLKAGFWRPLGSRAGWSELSNIEPFRRQHSHLYLNSQFIVALQRWRGRSRFDADLPPAWRRCDLPPAGAVALSARLWFRLRLALLERRLQRLPDSSDQDLWLQLMALDKLGERFSALYGQLQMVWLPEQQSFLPGLSESQCSLLVALAANEAQPELLAQRFPDMAPGNDPAWPRWSESPADMLGLWSLWRQIPEDRRQRIAQLKADHDPLSVLRADLEAVHGQLASILRRLLASMAQRLHAEGRLNHPDDVYFLYFDELWQCWRGEQRPGLASKLAQRKVRYLTDGHSGPPDWVIDQVGYGTSAFAQENRQPLLRGYPLVPGKVSGTVRRLASGWQLNQVCPGDILVLDQSDSGWLPWLCLAGALVLTHRDAHDPAVALARQLQIPAIWGVDDAMHCVVDGDVMEIDGDQGAIA
ncbi:PEP-utilizing enzyme [Alcanivorax sp. 1008]|uniref:PEP-utilizing enzyme n=1 Tax=Alcanivorax sp. 1008 TaxID=2816853 RepID=UPI001D43B87D|nr:PEP-utilizing enzyme [Alcanivorax sp. 1008]MCC1498098.1 pyruvate, phosphate dikinase [Alcanivorax sp. 1008]